MDALCELYAVPPWETENCKTLAAVAEDIRTTLALGERKRPAPTMGNCPNYTPVSGRPCS